MKLFNKMAEDPRLNKNREMPLPYSKIVEKLDNIEEKIVEKLDNIEKTMHEKLYKIEESILFLVNELIYPKVKWKLNSFQR